ASQRVQVRVVIIQRRTSHAENRRPACEQGFDGGAADARRRARHEHELPREIRNRERRRRRGFEFRGHVYQSTTAPSRAKLRRGSSCANGCLAIAASLI